MKKQTPRNRLAALPEPPPVAVMDTPERIERIHWKPSELEVLAQEFVTQIRKLNMVAIPTVGDRIGARFLNESLQAAQEIAIAPERRRANLHRANLTAAFWERAEKILGERVQAEKEEARKASLPPLPVAPPPPEKTIADFSDEDVIASAAVRIFRIFKQSSMSNAEVQEVRKKVGEVVQFGDLFSEELDVIRKQLSDLQSAREKLSQVRIVGLPRVAILGCRADQFEMVVKQCKQANILAEFRHFDQDRNPHQFTADYALSMKFVKHAWEDQAKRAVPPGHYAFISGGIGSVVMKIEEWLKPQRNGNGQ